MTEGSQEFCLRWNNHQATIISVFDYLLENETLVDCTLAAEGQYLKAHKVVLCACSPYLELLLSQHNDKHPILIFKDIKFSELKSMIEYMYKGEVNIAQDQLNHFLKAAESLQIKGLSESEEESTPTAAPTPRPPPPRAPPVQRTQPRPIPNTVALPDPHPESPKRLNRNEAVSPSRKRRRQVLPIQGRPSLSGDDASNASEGHLDQSNCDVPSAALATSDNSVAKVESNSELMLEPKTEYDDNSVEDITLDDDEEDYSQAGTSMDNSQMNFSGWQQMVGDKSGDDVFAGQDTGAQNSQGKNDSDRIEEIKSENLKRSNSERSTSNIPDVADVTGLEKTPAIEIPQEELVENIVVDVKIESMIPPEDDVDMEDAEDSQETEILLQQSLDNETHQAMIQDDKQMVFKRAETLPLDTNIDQSRKSGKLKDPCQSSSENKTDTKDSLLRDVLTSLRKREDKKHSGHDRNQSPSTSVSHVRTEELKTIASTEKLSENKPKIYLREEFQLKSKELIQKEHKCAKPSDCCKCKPTKLKCIHCNIIMDVNMDCILYHCKTCETIVRDQDEFSRESKYLCFACKVYVFDNTCGRTHIKKHISTHLKRMNLYEPGNTWY